MIRRLRALRHILIASQQAVEWWTGERKADDGRHPLAYLRIAVNEWRGRPDPRVVTLPEMLAKMRSPSTSSHTQSKE